MCALQIYVCIISLLVYSINIFKKQNYYIFFRNDKILVSENVVTLGIFLLSFFRPINLVGPR